MSDKGNWMHLHYQSPLQAKKALSKNARIFAASLQIGVTPCIDKVSAVFVRNALLESKNLKVEVEGTKERD